MIVKHVPANLEQVPPVSEYFPAIDFPISCSGKTSPYFLFCLPKIHLLVFQVKRVDVILAGKDIASVFSKILPDASVQTMPLCFG
jgi:hypothetical protein